MPMLTKAAARGRLSDWPLAAKSILGFWLFYALTLVARAFLGSDPLTMLNNKMLIVLIGVVLTGGVYLAIASLTPGASIGKKAVVAAIASFVAAWGMAGSFFAAEYIMREPKEVFRYQTREGIVISEKGHTLIVERRAQEPLVVTWPKMAELSANKRIRYAADVSVTWIFFFLAWSAFYIATLAQREALEAQQRAAEAESAARAAQVRALRYQVNPHFLFNTLNSLSSLVMSGRADRAEEMLMALSTFFRTSLSMDPSVDVSVAEEIALQRLYLDIEQVRFPNRLDVNIDIPDDLETARVPALILQPLVENAIKYGVSATTERVELSIRARRLDGGRMQLDVTNRALGGRTKKTPAPTHQGTGLGLANVSERLKAHFGNRADVRFGPIAGGYEVSLAMPVDDDD